MSYMRLPQGNGATLQQTKLISHFVIMRVEGKYILVVLLLCFLPERVTSGSSDCEVECCRGCEVHFTGKISKKHATLTERRSRSSSYSTSCGFWAWGSCRKYRRQYYIHTDYKTLYYSTVGMKCDPSCQCTDRVSMLPPAISAASNSTTSGGK
ncbi:uncharacterized protein LOC124110962 [Haliotis rufescens]|uniref:uncharacterized protein LOC124110962 n=1 Tax=Haliotis rufescens TaxID=6454 RepID=UPI001EB02BBA|nr:uncharacterized protein LOC124110962 [Haliotis rufescens]